MAKRILITQRHTEMLDTMADWLRAAGYRVSLCTGPSQVRYDCMAHSFDDCPLWRDVDLVIYDPWVATSYGGGDQFVLEMARHPETPAFVWGPSAIPLDVAELVEQGKVDALPLQLTRDVLIAAVEQRIGPALETARSIQA